MQVGQIGRPKKKKASNSASLLVRPTNSSSSKQPTGSPTIASQTSCVRKLARRERACIAAATAFRTTTVSTSTADIGNGPPTF